MAAIYIFIWAAFVWGCFNDTFAQKHLCPSACSCLGDYVDCSRMGLIEIPKDLPVWVTDLEIQSNGIAMLHPNDFKGLLRLQKIDLSNNEISDVDDSVFLNVPDLKELKMNSNKLKEIPVLKGNAALNRLELTHNLIHTVNRTTLSHLKQLDTLDLSNNNIMDVQNGTFPANLTITKLFMRNNKILKLEAGCFHNLTSLVSLKLNKNALTQLPADVFSRLENLRSLDLSKNQLNNLMGLAFLGLKNLQVLKLRRNSIHTLEDGVFFGLSDLQQLHLEENSITKISQQWVYGLENLKELHLAQNNIIEIEPKAWEFVSSLEIIDLSDNKLSTISSDSFMGLPKLTELLLANNKIQVVQEAAFDKLTSLLTLDLAHNAISSTIEDVKGVFTKLTLLRKLNLASNKIKMITKTAFVGLDGLEQLSLQGNNITSIEGTAFEPMPKLSHLTFNTSGLFCDCQLSWLPMWLRESNKDHTVIAKCAHPDNLKGRSIFSVDSNEFKCVGHFPKPEIVLNPLSHVVLKGDNITLNCSAASTESEGSPTHFEWKKDDSVLTDVDVKMENFANRKDNLTHYVSKLHISNAQDTDAGRYQCVISNDFGSAYSTRANINVYVFPKFTKKPQNVTAKARTKATLVCAASGEPKPIISWQKDGGFDHFPAAQERRMHVIPEDDHFYIMDVKAADEGVYSCIAKNDAGTIVSNVTLTVLQTPSFVRRMEAKETRVGATTVLECLAQGSPQPKLTWLRDGEPLVLTQRHFFTAEEQLLVIVETDVRDAGEYTCVMSNTLGTIRGTSTLTVITGSGGKDGNSRQEGGGGLDDESTTTGIIIIAVVCCVVGTSLVWVIIIYQTRKRQELYSATPTDETTLPGEVPSSGYMSSDKEGSYSQGLPITSMHGYQYSDMQMKESGYESSSGRFRAARSAAIFPSDVDGSDLPQNYNLLTADGHYVEQSDENSMSSQEYPRSDTDSLKSEINSVNSSRSSRQHILTTFQPHCASREALETPTRSRSCSASQIACDNITDTEKCEQGENPGSSLTEAEADQSCPPQYDSVCTNCGDRVSLRDGHMCKHYVPAKRVRHGRHKEHSHFDRAQPPGGQQMADVQDCVMQAYDESIPPPPPLVPCSNMYMGQEYGPQDGMYVPTSSAAYVPIYHPLNTPCECHMHYVPPPSHTNCHEQHPHAANNADMNNLTSPRNQRLNGIMGCVHHMNGMGAAWHGHAYTLPYMPTHVHQIQTIPAKVSPSRPSPSSSQQGKEHSSPRQQSSLSPSNAKTGSRSKLSKTDQEEVSPSAEET